MLLFLLIGFTVGWAAGVGGMVVVTVIIVVVVVIIFRRCAH